MCCESQASAILNASNRKPFFILTFPFENTTVSGPYQKNSLTPLDAGAILPRIPDMEQASRSPRNVRFGIFEADLDVGELRKHGHRLKLSEQPFQILAMLLARPGEIVSREELRQILWPSDTFVDFDHGLNNAVMRLREVLGDSSDHPRFIETLPRRGYRFIAPVEVKAQAAIGADPKPSADAAASAVSG